MPKRKPKPKARKPATHEYEIPQGFLTVRSLARGLTGLAPTSEIMVAGPGGAYKVLGLPKPDSQLPWVWLEISFDEKSTKLLYRTRDAKK